MARLRFIGSPWVRRSDTPILGLTGATGEGSFDGHSDFNVGTFTITLTGSLVMP